MRKIVRAFRRNYRINFQAFTPNQVLFYRCFVRPFLNSENRDFLEGVPGIAGQLYRSERRALHDAIIRRAPRYAFEIGTFNGGGSTYFAAKAFARLGRGKLITLEIDRGLSAAAIDLYENRLPALRAHVEFVLGGNPTLFEPYLVDAGAAEFVLLDGAESAGQSLEQFRFFEPWFRPGSILTMHDWNTEKMRLVRQELEASSGWTKRLVLGEPESIGFAVYELTGMHAHAR